MAQSPRGNMDIRTNFILRNIYAHFLRDHSTFPTIEAINEDETLILNQLKEMVNTFRSVIRFKFSETLQDPIQDILYKVLNNSFDKEITWGGIVVFFAFVRELLNSRNIILVEELYEDFSKLVIERLETWIHEHGGWKSLYTVQMLL